MKLGVSQSPVQSDDAVNITSVQGGSPTSRSHTSGPSCMTWGLWGGGTGHVVWASRLAGWGFAAGAIAEGGGGDDGWLLRRRQGWGGRGGGGRRSWSSSVGCGRPCDHAGQFPACFGLKVPQIQFIDSGWTFLLCVQRRVPTVQTVHMTFETIQVPFLDQVDMCVIVQRQVRSQRGNVVDISVVARRQFPLVLRNPLRFSSCSSLTRWSISVVQVQQILRCCL